MSIKATIINQSHNQKINLMKLQLLFWFILGTVFTINAQNPGVATGKVVDRSNNPVSYATISIKDGAKVLTGGITDDNGLFNIKNIPLKSLTVDVQFIGYKSYTTTADFSQQKTINFPKIVLEEEATQLSGVEIVQERSTIEQKIDRKVINVGRDLTTAGATASDIMGNIPSVNVD